MKNREEYINNIRPRSFNTITKSEPLFSCPKCGGNVRKNLNNCLCLTSNPPIYKYLYECDSCDYNEYLEG